MSDVEALAAALCPMSGLRPGAFDRCAVHGAHIDYATAILAALHESGYSIERMSEVARLRKRLEFASKCLHSHDPEHTRPWETCGWGDCAKDRVALAQPAPDATCECVP